MGYGTTQGVGIESVVSHSVEQNQQAICRSDELICVFETRCMELKTEAVLNSD